MWYTTRFYFSETSVILLIFSKVQLTLFPITWFFRLFIDFPLDLKYTYQKKFVQKCINFIVKQNVMHRYKLSRAFSFLYLISPSLAAKARLKFPSALWLEFQNFIRKSWGILAFEWVHIKKSESWKLYLGTINNVSSVVEF